MIRGMYFYSQKCKLCGKIIYGESEKSRKKAKKDFHHRLTEHRNQEHPNAVTKQKQRQAV